MSSLSYAAWQNSYNEFAPGRMKHGSNGGVMEHNPTLLGEQST